MFFDKLYVCVCVLDWYKEMRQSIFIILIQLLAFAVVVYKQYKIPCLKWAKK